MNPGVIDIVPSQADHELTHNQPGGEGSGRSRTVARRFIHNDRLVDALQFQAQVAVRYSPGAKAYYTRLVARGASYNTALRQVANRLVGILHGCLKNGALYCEETAWSHHVAPVT